MQVFEAPKRDKHGRIINEEDAEARQAARDLRRQREESRPVKEEQPVPQSGGKRSRRSNKAAPTQEVPAPPAPEPSAPAVKGRGVRAGSLLHTGDAMPNTEFQRPNPLDSDVIMDATARLLAPRRLNLTPAQPQPRQEQSRRRKKNASPAPQPVQEVQPSGQKKRKQKAAPPPAPASKKQRARQDRQSGRRGGAPQPPQRPRVKDSTEQPSLMKSYYLDIGR